MEATVRNLQQRYRRAKGEMERWEAIQSTLLSRFDNAASIIRRLEVLRKANNYGSLGCVPGIKETLLGKQMESLEMIISSLKETMKEFHGIVISLEKIARDASQVVKGRSMLTSHQMQLKIGIHPSLANCLDGLKTIHEMYRSEYLLKLSIVPSLTWKCSDDDITALRRLLVDQPNIPPDEVQSILDVIFAEEIC